MEGEKGKALCGLSQSEESNANPKSKLLKTTRRCVSVKLLALPDVGRLAGGGTPVPRLRIVS